MNVDLKKSLEHWIEQHLATEFLDKRASGLDKLTLKHLVRRKNPYLFMCKGHSSAREVIDSFVHAYLSSSEETLFGNFLEGMALHVCGFCFGGQKSSTPGLDLDFVRDGKRYLVSIKSSPHWGNADAKKKAADSLRKAKQTIGQARDQQHELVAVIGSMYGNNPPKDHGNYMTLAGKEFWGLISGIPGFHKEIVAPLRKVALARKKDIRDQIERVTQDLTNQFRNLFCPAEDEIDWEKVVEYNDMPSWPKQP